MLLFAYLPEICTFLLLIFASTQVAEIGPILVLGQFALVGLLFAVRPAAFLDTTLRWWPLLLAPIYCLFSALWSEVPALSARYAAQLLFSAFVGIHLARLMTPRRFVTVFMLAMFVFSLLCVAVGTTGVSAEGPVLIGLTGSKNQLGYIGGFLLLSAVAVLMLGRIAVATRWVAILSLPLAAYILIEVNSATALLLAVAGAAVLLALAVSQRLPPGGRLAAIIGALLVIAPLTALTPEAQAWLEHFMFDTLNKDPTLTGRTILWARADDLIARRPLFGYGYQSIWLGDTIDTIALQRWSGITDGRTFHFHHQFRQIAVDTGLIGLAVFVIALVATLGYQLRQYLLRPSVPTSFFMVMFMLFVARSFSDLVLSALSVHTVMFFAAARYGYWRPAENTAEAHARGHALWPVLPHALQRPLRAAGNFRPRPRP